RLDVRVHVARSAASGCDDPSQPLFELPLTARNRRARDDHRRHRPVDRHAATLAVAAWRTIRHSAKASTGSNSGDSSEIRVSSTTGPLTTDPALRREGPRSSRYTNTPAAIATPTHIDSCQPSTSAWRAASST